MAFSNKGKSGGSSYDPNLDVEVFSKEVEVGDSKIVLSVYSYNKGEKKLQITRSNKSKEDGSWVFAKLGRLKKDEVTALYKAIPEVHKSL